MDASFGAFIRVKDLPTVAELPGRLPGKKISKSTVFRWISKGVRGGIRLRTILVGGLRCTTLVWLREFLDALNGQEEVFLKPPDRRPPGKRQRSSCDARQQRDKLWAER